MLNKKVFPVGSKTGIAILIIFIVMIFSFLGEEPSQVSKNSIATKTYVPDEIDLHIQAQQFVLQTLKAPSTAKFPALPYEAGSLGDGFYGVKSYVDSQNSFGAMIRSNWSVTMKITGNQWALEKMIFDDKVVFNSVKENCVRNLALKNAELVKQKMESGVPFSESDMANQLSEYERQKRECYK